MNRDIKFRVWDTKNKEWITRVDVQAVHDTIGWGHDFFLEVCNHHDDSFDIENWDPTRYVVCQGTGLKDKNGKDVFEGDIVTNGDENKVIVFDAIARGCEPFIEMAEAGWQSASEDDVEVIGNIYENPELI